MGLQHVQFRVQGLGSTLLSQGARVLQPSLLASCWAALGLSSDPEESEAGCHINVTVKDEGPCGGHGTVPRKPSAKAEPSQGGSGGAGAQAPLTISSILDRTVPKEPPRVDWEVQVTLRGLSQVAVFSKADWVCNDIYENVSTPAVGHVADTSVPPCNVSRRRAHRNTTVLLLINTEHSNWDKRAPGAAVGEVGIPEPTKQPLSPVWRWST
ncbi:unnamed protein product [Arctogadus glacialis]